MYQGLPDNDSALSQPMPKLVFVGRYAILDEHELPATPNRPTKLIVDKEKLQRISNNNNKRVVDTGDKTPLVIGHTDDNSKESEQPEVVGFCDKFEVQPFFDTGRYAIWADFYIKENKIELARDYPRRSVELWAGREEIDPISLLGATTPERDLGLMQFNRNSETPYSYSIMEDKIKMASEKKMDDKDAKKDDKKEEKKEVKEDKAPPDKESKKEASSPESQATEAMIAAFMQSAPMQQLISTVQKQGEATSKIMEILNSIEQEDSQEPQGQETPPNSQPAPEQEQKPDGKDAAKFNEPPPVKFESMPSGTNTFVPSTKENYSRKEKEMADESDIVIRLSRLEEENKALKAKAEETAIQYRKDNAKALIEKLEAENYVFADKDEELQLMEQLSLDAQKVHYERVKKNYKQEKKGPNSEGVNKALQFSRDGTEKGPKSMQEAIDLAAKAAKEGRKYNEVLEKSFGTK